MSRRDNRDLQVGFNAAGLTSFAGLELLIRYCRARGLNARLRHHLAGVLRRGDFGAVAMVRLLLGLLVAAGRRLRHVAYLAGDPLLHRFCGLAHLLSARTVSRWLKQCRERSVERLRQTGAPRRWRSAKAAALHVLRSVQTLRLELFHRASELVRPHGLATLRLPVNPGLRRRFERVARMLPHAA